ncbi:MAG: OmpP1/FadL family transporter [Mangrovibacterium sp.]
MKKIQYIIILLLFSSPAWSQGLTDALRLSNYRLNGTARATAMGNAFGSLGGDFTSASINPAGLGLYRSSEFVFSTRFGENKVDGTYLNHTNKESEFHLSVPNIGYVAAFNPGPNNGSSLISINLGIGYNRMNDFNTKKLVSGDNATSTMLDGFAANANNDIWDLAYEELAWQTDLLLKDESTNVYWNDIAEAGHGQSQRKSFSHEGSIDEYLFSLAANFNHKVYVGATLGIHDVYFRERTRLYEYDRNNDIPYFNDYTFDTFSKTTGTGFNAKFGLIYKPVDALRLGVAFHTPTFYDLHDRFYNDMYSSITYDDGTTDNLEALSDYFDYDYKLQTPMKAVFSAAYVIGKQGLISVDYEWVDYSKIKLSDGGNGYEFYDENDEIDEALHSVGNLHVGGEFRLSEYFSLRGGFEYLPSPYKGFAFGNEQLNGDADTYTYSFGLGWKAGNFFADLAYKYVDLKDYVFLYQVPANLELPAARFKNQSDFVTLTLGFRF